MIRKDSPVYRRLFARDLSCVWHGRDCDQEMLVPQHRANRGIGGYRAGDALSNLVLLCSSANWLVEHDAALADDARRLGIKISRHADPRTVPVQHQQHGLVLLDDDGGFKRVEEDRYGLVQD